MNGDGEIEETERETYDQYPLEEVVYETLFPRAGELPGNRRIVEVKIDLRPLTVFVGPSNTGKSCLVILSVHVRA